MRWFFLIAVALIALAVAPAARSGPKTCAPRELRYPDVEPIFAKHCASCHDARKGDNKKAQAVFEMTRYPFSTERPDTLVEDLEKMFQTRGSLSDAEKCDGLNWVRGGAKDAEGKAPVWRR